MAVDAPEKTPSLAEQWSVQDKEQVDQVEDVASKLEDVSLTDANSEEVVALSPNETPEESDEVPVEQQEEDAEETPEIKIETAPADFRFPTTNQTRHCFTRYIEYHRCVAAKGYEATECNKFAKYYRALCPSEWVERWNEQRENGTFPGPL